MWACRLRENVPQARRAHAAGEGLVVLRELAPAALDLVLEQRSQLLGIELGAYGENL